MLLESCVPYGKLIFSNGATFIGITLVHICELELRYTDRSRTFHKEIAPRLLIIPRRR